MINIKKLILTLAMIGLGGWTVLWLLSKQTSATTSGEPLIKTSHQGYFTGIKYWGLLDNVLPPIYTYYDNPDGLLKHDQVSVAYDYNIRDVTKKPEGVEKITVPNKINDSYEMDKNEFIYRIAHITKKFFKTDDKSLESVKEAVGRCKALEGTNIGVTRYRVAGVLDDETCLRWFRTGYLFVLASLGEVTTDDDIYKEFKKMLKDGSDYFEDKYIDCKKSNASEQQSCNVNKFFDEEVAGLIKSRQSGENHKNRIMTFTYVTGDHTIQYPGDPNRAKLLKQNTAATRYAQNGLEKYGDIIAFDYYSKGSPAVIIWQKDGTEPAKPVWALRVACANPLGTRLPVSVAEISSQISVDQKTVYLQTGAKKTVKFNYDISKKANNETFNAEYIFSGSAGHFNHQNIKYLNHELLQHTYGSLGDVPQEDFKTLRSDSGGGKVALGDKLLDMRVKYEETYELDFDKKNWRPISLNKGEICRTIEARAVGATSVLPPKKQTVCVEIYIGATPPPNATGLYIDSLVPEIASPGYPINELTNGLVTYAIRPKQWVDDSRKISKGESDCLRSDPKYSEQIEKECKDYCDGDKENNINCKVVNPKSSSKTCVYSSYRCEWECWGVPPKRQCGYTSTCYEYGDKYSAEGTCTYLKRSTADTNWRVTKFLLYPEDKAVNASMNLDNNEEPCKYYTGRTTGNNCVTQFSGSNQFDSSSIYSIVGGHNPLAGLMRIHITPGSVGGSIPKAIPSSTTGFVDSKYDVDNLPTGTKVCFGVSVNQWQIGNSSNGNKTIQWAHSKPECFVVSKKPYFSVKNGLVVSGGKIITGLNKRKGNNNVAGSATEYAAISRGRISPQFSTSLLLDGSVRVQTADYMNWHRLTLANPDPNNLGSFGKPPEDLIKAIDYFRVRGKSHNGNFVTHQAGVYVVKGKATISGNIVDTKTNNGANSGNPRNIQQMVIIADEIEIKNNVTQIDAWLMTSGVLSTSDHALTDAGIKAGADESKLVINGPVYAEHIRLRRKYGSGIKSDKNPNNLASGKNQLSEPAERFIDNTDTYIWGYYNSLERGQYQTVYMREVAPRY